MPLSYPFPDATSTLKGKIQLTGDLGGTAASPTVVGAQQGVISAAALSTSAITLGFASSTSTFTLSSSQTTPTQVTGLSITVTIPAGGRRIRVTAYTSSLSPASGVALLTIWDGTVNVGTQLQQYNSAANNGANCQVIISPAAGSKTYNVGVSNSGLNTTTVSGSATNPSFILVEAI